MRPSLFVWAVAPALAFACTDLDFVGAGGAAQAGGGTGLTGAGGASGGAGTGGAGVGGAGGTGGVPPCDPAAPEVCNGFDDDCDGIADNPPSGVGTVCPEQEWQVGPDGRLYVAIPTNGDDVTTLDCPIGMERAVVQTQAELTFLAVFVPAPTDHLLLGLFQDTDRSHPIEGWSWVRSGMPIPWSGGEPDDFLEAKPVAFETNAENCAGLYDDSLGGVLFADLPCADAAARYVCEELGDGPQVGGACLLAEGCSGVWDAMGTCLPIPKFETCNGLDDACTGTLAEDAACSCTVIVDPGSNRSYKDCSLDAVAADMHCGPGYRLALPESVAEQTFLLSRMNMVNPGQPRMLGLIQPLGQADVAAGWAWLDGAPLALPWDAGQPGDVPTFGEQDEQNCATLTGGNGGGLHDSDCAGTQYRHFCEQWP